MKTFRAIAGSLLMVIPVACGGGEKAQADAAPFGPIQAELAEQGEQLFREKGCVACHTIGKGRLVGPDLREVTERREYRWVIEMMTNPDSMLRNDPTAKQLLAEYFTPMTNQNVSAQDARALYEYLRSETASEGEEPAEDEERTGS